jgi:hypothetical protein
MALLDVAVLSVVARTVGSGWRWGGGRRAGCGRRQGVLGMRAELRRELVLTGLWIGQWIGWAATCTWPSCVLAQDGLPWPSAQAHHRILLLQHIMTAACNVAQGGVGACMPRVAYPKVCCPPWRALLAPRPQAPHLRWLGWRGVLDLWSGPWDGLARLTSLRTLVLNHCRKTHVDAAYARDLHERGRLGWLLDLAQPRRSGRLVVPLPAPRFELAWLPRGLERCSIALPAGTRVVRPPQPEADQPQPLAFKVEGSTVKLEWPW